MSITDKSKVNTLLKGDPAEISDERTEMFCLVDAFLNRICSFIKDYNSICSDKKAELTRISDEKGSAEKNIQKKYAEEKSRAEKESLEFVKNANDGIVLSKKNLEDKITKYESDFSALKKDKEKLKDESVSAHDIILSLIRETPDYINSQINSLKNSVLVELPRKPVRTIHEKEKADIALSEQRRNYADDLVELAGQYNEQLAKALIFKNAPAEKLYSCLERLVSLAADAEAGYKWYENKYAQDAKAYSLTMEIELKSYREQMDKSIKKLKEDADKQAADIKKKISDEIARNEKVLKEIEKNYFLNVKNNKEHYEKLEMEARLKFDNMIKNCAENKLIKAMSEEFPAEKMQRRMLRF